MACVCFTYLIGLGFMEASAFKVYFWKRGKGEDPFFDWVGGCDDDAYFLPFSMNNIFFV